MHGFYPGRLRDRSAAVFELKYVWPIGPWLNGTLQGALGNVFGEHLEDFDTKLLRFSAGFGLSLAKQVTSSTTSSDGPPVELLIGFGTDTIERGASPTAFRVSFGVPHLF
jgi:hypothetical protein